MQEAIKTYIAELNKLYATGVAREHAYRVPLQNLMTSLLPKGYTIVNEPARIACGAPDYIILHGDVPMAFMEAKDLDDRDLDGNREHREQFERYKNSLNSIVFTDYLDFHLYISGEFQDAVRLAEIRGNKIVVNEANEEPFLQMVSRLVNSKPQKITSPVKLAKVMANKARMLAQVIEKALDNDPMMHFYEDFLGQYDPQTKAQRGVYYTPQPVVDFIVRAVDDILKRDFNLPMGLADNSMIDHEVVNDQYSGKKGESKTLKKRMHRVQILDPATGTGTFLATVIRQIHANMEGQWGAWGSYVEQHLLPRLNGFELMMASYTIAHLKLNMVLRETGFTQQSDKRLRVYLTNSLEDHNVDTGTLFSAAISQESNEASHIKRDCPVMVMIGNPPYSVSSSNNSDYILRLLNDYKKNLNERNIQPLSDDYIKFIRLGQEYISKTGEGILAFICNNSFIDGIIHRQMRKELMERFDEIYILDLHGNSRKKETALDGSKDENVFDIMPGVSINILVKKPHKTSGCKVFHYDLTGIRNKKYEFLDTRRIADVEWLEITPKEPQYFFVPKDFSQLVNYEKGFKIDELMGIKTVGVATYDDGNLVSYERFETQTNYMYLYRPFDFRWIDYNLNKVARHRFNVMCHFVGKDNIGLVCIRNNRDDAETYFVTTILADKTVISPKDNASIYPLYLYNEDGSVRVPNLDKEICSKIKAAVGEEISPEDLFDYIYAVLHSPSYRAKYKEFLKIDFPRIPYPESAEKYHRLASIGGQLRKLHLMEEVPPTKHAQFNNPGSNVVDKPEYKGGSVWINKEQCFEDVPETAWNFYIGGYQPAQKWLKDRKGRTLTFDDIAHYRKIITVLLETDRLMKEIDEKN